MAETDSALETRLVALEDRLAIFQLMASHPPAIDAGVKEYWAQTWTDDSWFDRGPQDPQAHSGNYSGIYGKETLLEEFMSPEIEANRAHGLAHLTTTPFLTLTGDYAIATNYTLVFGFENPGFGIRRLVANRWELVKDVSKTWRIKSRTLRLLDGDPDARRILRDGIWPAVVPSS